MSTSGDDEEDVDDNEDDDDGDSKEDEKDGKDYYDANKLKNKSNSMSLLPPPGNLAEAGKVVRLQCFDKLNFKIG